jgi:hypothetical protein
MRNVQRQLGTFPGTKSCWPRTEQSYLQNVSIHIYLTKWEPQKSGIAMQKHREYLVKDEGHEKFMSTGARYEQNLRSHHMKANLSDWQVTFRPNGTPNAPSTSLRDWGDSHRTSGNDVRQLRRFQTSFDDWLPISRKFIDDLVTSASETKILYSQMDGDIQL